MEARREAVCLPPLGFPGSLPIITRCGSWTKAIADAGAHPGGVSMDPYASLERVGDRVASPRDASYDARSAS